MNSINLNFSHDISKIDDNEWMVIEFLLNQSKSEIIQMLNLQLPKKNNNISTQHRQTRNHPTILPSFDSLVSITRNIGTPDNIVLDTPSKSVTTVNFKKKRRSRYISRNNLKIMEQYYEENRYPDFDTKVYLGTIIGRSYRYVQIWFQNKRAKDKKANKDNKLQHPVI